MKNKRTSDIRFAGFTRDWEERKLGEGTLKIGDGLHGTPQYSANGNIAFINGNNLVNGKITINSQTKYVTSDQQSKDDKELNQNTILMSINGTIGNLAWYNGEKVMLGKSAAYIEVSSFDKNFMYQLLQTSKIKSYFLNNLTGTTIKNLGLKTIRDTPTLVPKIDEQKRIGQFFKQLDETIAFYQQELTILKQTKQGFLQKMFPKEGKFVPEVRFPGFTGDWEQCKLKDIAVFNPKSVLPEQFEYVDLESVVGTDLISHRTEHRESAPSRAQRLAKQGDVFYQTVRPYQKNNYLFDLPYDNYVFSTGYAQMRPNVDSYFLFSKLQEEKFVSSVLDRCTGTSYPAINSNDLAQIEVRIPILGEEQIKIGNFFKQLDDTISLHQRELKALKETKKAFLQKMFV